MIFKKSGVCWYPSDFMCLEHHLPHISSKKSRACLHSCLEETKFVKIGQIGQVVTQTACPQTLLSAQFHFPFKKLGSVNNMEGPG